MTPSAVASPGSTLANAPLGTPAPAEAEPGTFAGLLEGVFAALVEHSPAEDAATEAPGEPMGDLDSPEPGAAEHGPANDALAALLLAYEQPQQRPELIAGAPKTPGWQAGAAGISEPGVPESGDVPLAAASSLPDMTASQPSEPQATPSTAAANASSSQPEAAALDPALADQPASQPSQLPVSETQPGNQPASELELSPAPPAESEAPNAVSRSRPGPATQPEAPSDFEQGQFEPSGIATPENPASDSVVRFVGNADSNEEQATFEQAPAGDSDAGPTSKPSAVAGSVPSPVEAAATPAAGDVETQPAATADLPPAVHQVGEAILERVDQSGGEAVIRLDPPELGSVHIRVTLNGDTVQVQIEAERPEALALLREHTQHLSTLLSDRGLNLADVHVGQGGQGQQQSAADLPAWSFRRRGGDDSFARLMGLEPSATTRAHARLQAAYNPDGYHLYRI